MAASSCSGINNIGSVGISCNRSISGNVGSIETAGVIGGGGIMLASGVIGIHQYHQRNGVIKSGVISSAAAKRGEMKVINRLVVSSLCIINWLYQLSGVSWQRNMAWRSGVSASAVSIKA